MEDLAVMEPQVAERPQSARERLALRLPGADVAQALELARRCAPWFGVAKIGIDLLASAGPALVEELRREGLVVFCDVKLHDIPDQVRSSADALARLGAGYVTMHAAGGEAMLRAGIEGLRAGAQASGHREPAALGVTVLTSDPDPASFDARLATVVAAGCAGVVCSAHEASRARGAREQLVVVTPGIRLAARDDDQARVATPADAVAAGADVLVVGRPVTSAPDPEAVARQMFDDVTGR